MIIDTTVLLNVLNVPGSASIKGHAEDVARFQALVADGSQLVLPLTTVIETGNAIAKVGVGDRYRCIEAFVAFVRATVEGKAPWVAAGFGSTTALLSGLLDGPIALKDLMVTGVGAGDAAIIAEVADLRTRIPSATPIEIWTHDAGLIGHNS